MYFTRLHGQAASSHIRRPSATGWTGWLPESVSMMHAKNRTQDTGLDFRLNVLSLDESLIFRTGLATKKNQQMSMWRELVTNPYRETTALDMTRYGKIYYSALRLYARPLAVIVKCI